ncbi:MAG: hypothetical protein COX43_03525 [Parcubacteria group bacterium CG23_combo_of_CG06-09_8_20_14_all_35_9]|nr:MAG: hypothetical protein COX43_03525 [Parcubacteria group bacterium CG23_combo_of_CG06-09_8_20_14_all_35_9]
MYLTVHATCGILIAQKTDNILWAFIFSFISHFILDAIPHGDQELLPHLSRAERLKRIVPIASIDITIATVLISTLIFKNFLVLSPIILAGITGATLPDFLNGFYELCDRKFFVIYGRFHHFCHHIIKKIQFSFWVGFALQIIVLSLMLAYFLKI